MFTTYCMNSTVHNRSSTVIKDCTVMEGKACTLDIAYLTTEYPFKVPSPSQKKKVNLIYTTGNFYVCWHPFQIIWSTNVDTNVGNIPILRKYICNLFNEIMSEFFYCISLLKIIMPRLCVWYITKDHYLIMVVALWHCFVCTSRSRRMCIEYIII